MDEPGKPETTVVTRCAQHTDCRNIKIDAGQLSSFDQGSANAKTAENGGRRTTGTTDVPPACTTADRCREDGSPFSLALFSARATLRGHSEASLVPTCAAVRVAYMPNPTVRDCSPLANFHPRSF